MSNDTFALTTGQAHKLEMGFRRTGWDNAEVEVLCMGNNLALVKDLINGKLEYTYKQAAAPAQKPAAKPLLIPVGTAAVAATEESIVLSPEILRERYNIKWRGGNFDGWFLGKTILSFAGSTLANNKLARRSVDMPIITELGGAIAARTEPIEMLQLVEAQKHGPKSKPGPLLTNGYANIFYWEDQIRFPEDEQVAYTNEAGEKVVLRAVFVDWIAGGDGWRVFAIRVTHPLEWNGGDRVFSRSSRLPSAA